MIQTSGERLLRLIKHLKLTQSKLARQVGTSPSMVSDVVGGRREMTRSFAARIASVTGTTERWLLAGEGEMLPMQPATTGGNDTIAMLQQAMMTMTETLRSMQEANLINARANERNSIANEQYASVVVKLTDMLEKQLALMEINRHSIEQ